jgi:DNA-binding transcriptional LysR family regulator
MATTKTTHHGFDWNLARSFLAALDHGSLLGAARALRTSQPTVGRHIAELESQLGVLLFERTGRGLVPTATATELAHNARAMEASAQALSRSVSGAQAQVAGTVRITASGPVAAYLLPTVLGQMRQHLPDIQVELVASSQVSNLLRREADIAVRMLRPDQATLVARKLGEVRLCVCAHRDYLARHPAIRVPADLLSHTLIGSDQDSAILDGFKALGNPVTPAHFALRCDDFVVQWQAVRAALGVGFAAEYMLRTEAQVLPVLSGQLRIPPLPMWLAVHREIRTSQRIRAVYDFLASSLPDLI